MQIQHSPARTLIVTIVACTLWMASAAYSQVRIDMPAPPRASPATHAVATSPDSASMPDDATIISSSGSTVVAHVDAPESSADTIEFTTGDIALYRYARARTGTRNTYFNDGSMWDDHVRVYTYPRFFTRFAWGPWFGWPFWRTCW